MNIQINAITVSGTKKGWNYPTLSATFKTESEHEAIERAKTIADGETIFTTQKVVVHHIDTKLESNNYPYGSLRTTAFFSVEYNKNKGCRTIFQTINPKTDRLNNPKKSTYTQVILPCTIKETNHFDSCGYLDFNGTQSINKGLMFMSDFFECFNPEQIKEIAVTALAFSKMNFKALVIYTNVNWENLKPLVDKSTKTLVEIANTGLNKFSDCLLPMSEIKALEDPNYNPFVIKEVSY